MSNLHYSETAEQPYYLSLDEMREDGYAPLKCKTYLSFYCLKGKTTSMVKENIIPIAGIKYCYYQEEEKRYYVKDFHNYTIDETFFFKTQAPPEGMDCPIDILRRRIEMETVWLLFDKEQVTDMGKMLERVYNSYWKDKGKLPYNVWLALLEQSLKREDYVYHASNEIGFRTVCKLFDTKLKKLWDLAKDKQDAR